MARVGALNHRDFRLFFGGQLISQVGTWMQSVAQAWLVTELTDSRVKLGLISSLQFLPLLLLGLVGGALADRLPKRKTLVWTQAVMMLLAFILAALVWTGVVQYWHVALLALGLGFANALDMPFRQSFIVEMVAGKEDLGSAIALNSALNNGARIVGPAVAGLFIARYGIALAFLSNGLSFIPVIGALLAMGAQGLPHRRSSQPILRDIGEGLRYVMRTPMAFFLLSLLFAIGLFVINYTVLVTVLARDVLHTGAQGYGYLMSALGLGALIGALLLAVRDRSEPKLTPLITAGLGVCTVVTLMFFARSFTVALVGLLAMGLTQILYAADTNTTLQVIVPDELRGRVMSIFQLLLAGTTPIGALWTGAIIDRFGGSVGFLTDGGLGLILALALVTWWLWAGRRRGEARSPR